MPEWKWAHPPRAGSKANPVQPNGWLTCHDSIGRATDPGGGAAPTTAAVTPIPKPTGVPSMTAATRMTSWPLWRRWLHANIPNRNIDSGMSVGRGVRSRAWVVLEGPLHCMLAVARRHHQLGLDLAAGVQGAGDFEDQEEGHKAMNGLDQTVILN